MEEARLRDELGCTRQLRFLSEQVATLEFIDQQCAFVHRPKPPINYLIKIKDWIVIGIAAPTKMFGRIQPEVYQGLVAAYFNISPDQVGSETCLIR